jgi:hypothetical protein
VGHLPGGGSWAAFLFAREEGVGVGFRTGGKRVLACCLTPLHSPVQALAYVPIGDGAGALLAQVAPQAEAIRYECFQCVWREGMIPRHANGRSRGLPQIGLVIVSANAQGSNDGFLTAFTGDRVFDRDRIHLPPVCPDERCPIGLAWGVLELGTERIFNP